MERERLTITLRKDILKLVDQSIDGAKLRNRSHAIEYFLSQQLASKVARVVVALPTATRTLYQAGGMQIGVRGSMADSYSKEVLSNIASQGFKEVLIVGTDNNAVQAAAVDADSFELDAKTSVLEGQSEAVADIALHHIESHIKDETFVYWDARFSHNINLQDLLDFHRSSKALGTIAVAQTSRNSPQNSDMLLAQLHGSRVESFKRSDALASGLPVVGVMVFEPAIFALSKGRALYRDVLPALAAEGKLNGFAFVAEPQGVREVAASMR